MPSWTILAPFGALIATVVATEGAVLVLGAIRDHDYRRFKDRSAAQIADRFPLPESEGTPVEAVYKATAAWAGLSHAHAKVAQTRYHNAVVRSAACLALAFAALAISTIPDEGWPSTPNLSHRGFELLLSWTEALCLTCVFVLFLVGRLTHRPWINRRAAAELMRQYRFIVTLFPESNREGADDTLQDRFGTEAATVNALVRDGPSHEVGVRAGQFWLSRRAAMASRPVCESDLLGDAIVLYLRNRVRAQLIWFTDSKARLEAIADVRARLLMLLFALTLGLALIKHGFVLANVPPPAPLLPGLLVVTGVAAAMTAYYFNQNARSLIHRYSTQQRVMSRWLTNFNETWPFTSLTSAPLRTSTKYDIRNRVLEFEDLMIDEFIDWAHITSHDTIELAP